MPAYDRFWDLAVTTGVHYDFTDEIVEACIYQRETKQKNNVKGKALITLPLLKNWHKAAAQCLNKIVASEVLFSVSINEMMEAMNGDLGSMLKRKSLLHSGVSATLIKRLRGFTVGELPPNDKLPANFAGIFMSMVGSSYSLANAPLSTERLVMIVQSTGRPSLDRLSQENANFGYLSTAVDMADIAATNKDDFTRSAVNWILGGGASKIRITCHGDGEGNLEMLAKTAQGEVLNAMSADCLAKWLHANGLTEKKNLQVISMNLCMAAKHNLTPAVINNGQYSPAQGSAVELVARTLGEFRVHGVKVTGSNEVVSSIDESAVDPNNDNRLAQVGDANLRPGQNVRRIQIPDGGGFTFTASTLTLTLPTGWTVEPRQKAGSQLYGLKPPDGWTVERIVPAIKRPENFANTDFRFKGPGGKLCNIPSQGWIVDKSEVLTAEGWTLAGPNTIKFKGTGGAIAVEGKPGPGEIVRIFERIAKSGAKAVAVS